MQLAGLHIVLTYQCVFECGHCFIWGSPRKSGVFPLERLDAVLDQVSALGTIDELCFEGGETFVYYPILIAAIRHAAAQRFRTAVITNGYWANSAAQAHMWLGRLVDAGLQGIHFVADSNRGEVNDMAAHPGVVVAQELGLETCIVGIGACANAQAGWPQLARTTSEDGAPQHPWDSFTACPYRELGSPGYVHIDPFGNVHLCQGLLIGNVFERPLAEIVATHAPDSHPIIGPLLAGGPAALVSRYALQPEPGYTDACQLCWHSRALLGARW